MNNLNKTTRFAATSFPLESNSYRQDSRPNGVQWDLNCFLNMRVMLSRCRGCKWLICT